MEWIYISTHAWFMCYICIYIYIKLTYILNILSFRPCAGLTDELGDDEEGSAWAEHVLNAACHMHAIV